MRRYEDTKIRRCASTRGLVGLSLLQYVCAGETTHQGRQRRQIRCSNVCLQDILIVSWKDHMTIDELLQRAGIGNLQDILP